MNLINTHLTSARGEFITYLLDRDDVRQPWIEYTEHQFVEQMANGTLPLENFKSYLIQGELNLLRARHELIVYRLPLPRVLYVPITYFAMLRSYQVQFSRANALSAYKAKSIDDIKRVGQNQNQN